MLRFTLRGRHESRPCKKCFFLDWLLECPLQRGRKSLDLRTRRRFRHADQRVLRKFRIRRAQHIRAHDLFTKKMRVDQFHRTWQLERELVKKWSIECAPHAGNFLELSERELRLGNILQCHLAQPFFAEKGQMNRRGQRAERLIGTDVRGRFLAPDVLFAGGERQHKAAAAFRIRRLSREAARHLPHVFVSSPHPPPKRPPPPPPTPKPSPPPSP